MSPTPSVRASRRASISRSWSPGVNAMAPSPRSCLAGFQEAPVQEALARQDTVVGHQEIAHEAIGQPALPGQIGGQRIEERLLGPVRLGMGRQVEPGGPQHAVQIGEDELRIRSRRVTHRRTPRLPFAPPARPRRSRGAGARSASRARRGAGPGSPAPRRSRRSRSPPERLDGLRRRATSATPARPGRDVPQDRHGLVAPERAEGADGFEPHLGVDVPRPAGGSAARRGPARSGRAPAPPRSARGRGDGRGASPPGRTRPRLRSCPGRGQDCAPGTSADRSSPSTSVGTADGPTFASTWHIRARTCRSRSSAKSAVNSWIASRRPGRDTGRPG